MEIAVEEQENVPTVVALREVNENLQVVIKVNFEL